MQQLVEKRVHVTSRPQHVPLDFSLGKSTSMRFLLRAFVVCAFPAARAAAATESWRRGHGPAGNASPPPHCSAAGADTPLSCPHLAGSGRRAVWRRRGRVALVAGFAHGGRRRRRDRPAEAGDRGDAGRGRRFDGRLDEGHGRRRELDGEDDAGAPPASTRQRPSRRHFPASVLRPGRSNLPRGRASAPQTPRCSRCCRTRPRSRRRWQSSSSCSARPKGRKSLRT